MSLERELGQIMSQRPAMELRRMYRRRDPAMNEILRRYVEAGWRMNTLAKVLGVDNGTVRQRVTTARARHAAGWPAPEGIFIVVAPLGVPAIPGISRSAPKTGPFAESRRLALEVLDFATLRKIRRLQKLATKCVMYSAPDSPERLASEELTHVLWELNQKGVPLSYLDAVLHLGHGTVHSRLVAHGYRPPTEFRQREKRLYRNYTGQIAATEEGTVDSDSQMH